MKITKLISLFLLCKLSLAYDIIQVDVGNAIDFSGVLTMSSTRYVDPSHHGTRMAQALEDELKKQRSKPVTAKQIVWDHHFPETIYSALYRASKEKPLVLSLSYSGTIRDPLEEAHVLLNTLNDTIVIVAAGNGSGVTGYPANYPNPCILSVGVTHGGRKAYYSNEAMVWLEYSPKDPEGTSASTARMAGIVLQLRRNYPRLTCAKIALTARMLYGKIRK